MHTHSCTVSWALIGHCLLQTLCKRFQTFSSPPPPPKTKGAVNPGNKHTYKWMDYSLKNIITAASSHEISHRFCLVCFGLCRKRGTFAATSPLLPTPKLGFTYLSSRFIPLDRLQARILRFSMYGVPATKEDGRGSKPRMDARQIGQCSAALWPCLYT